MDKVNIKKLIYYFVLLCVCWAVFIFLPIQFAEQIFRGNGSLLFLYLIIIPIIFSIIVYKKIGFEKNKEKNIAVILGIIIPIILLYYFVYIEIQKGFNLSF